MPTKAFACICVHIFCTIYERGVLAQGGERIVYGPNNSDRANKMLYLSKQKEITDIKSFRTNFLKMIITWAIFAAFIGNMQLLQHLFVFVHQKNNFLVI